MAHTARHGKLKKAWHPQRCRPQGTVAATSGVVAIQWNHSNCLLSEIQPIPPRVSVLAASVGPRRPPPVCRTKADSRSGQQKPHRDPSGRGGSDLRSARSKSRRAAPGAARPQGALRCSSMGRRYGSSCDPGRRTCESRSTAWPRWRRGRWRKYTLPNELDTAHAA